MLFASRSSLSLTHTLPCDSTTNQINQPPPEFLAPGSGELPNVTFYSRIKDVMEKRISFAVTEVGQFGLVGDGRERWMELVWHAGPWMEDALLTCS